MQFSVNGIRKVSTNISGMMAQVSQELDNTRTSLFGISTNLVQFAAYDGKYLVSKDSTEKENMIVVSGDEGVIDAVKKCNSIINQVEEYFEQLREKVNSLERSADAIQAEYEKILKLFGSDNMDDINKLCKEQGMTLYGNDENSIFNLYSKGDSTGKFSITEEDLEYITKICIAEQGDAGLEAIIMEASLIANRYEIELHDNDNRGHYTSIINYIKNSDWFTNSVDKVANGEINDDSKISKYKEYIEQTLCGGVRTLPKFADQHDYVSFNSDGSLASNSDISKIVNPDDSGNYSVNVTSVEECKPGVTRFYQSSSVDGNGDDYWVYYANPSGDLKNDSFGTYKGDVNKSLQEKYGNYCTSPSKIND